MVVQVLLGWLWLACCGYGVLRLFFRIGSPVTYVAGFLGWLVAMVRPGWVAVRHALQRKVAAALTAAAIALPGVAAIVYLGPPVVKPEQAFWYFRSDLARVAAAYDPRDCGGTMELPWRLRPLSLDGRAHVAGPAVNGKCALSLVHELQGGGRGRDRLLPGAARPANADPDRPG